MRIAIRAGFRATGKLACHDFAARLQSLNYVLVKAYVALRLGPANCSTGDFSTPIPQNCYTRTMRREAGPSVESQLI